MLPSSKSTSDPSLSAADGDRDLGDDGSSEAASVGKGKLNCMNAGECDGYNLYRQEFLLNDPDASWQGQIWGKCFECAKFEDKTAFKRKCKQLWEERAKLVRGRRDRARCVQFNNVTHIISEALPGASKTTIRKLAVERCKAIASAWLAGFDKMSKPAQMLAHQLNQEYLKNLDAAAKDPANACSVDANTLTSTETSYLTRVQEGIDLMFICRMPKCMFFGLNTDWVKHVSKEQFKCPCCGEQYRPSADYKNSVEAAYMLQIVDPITGDMARIPTTWPPSEDID